MREFDASSVLQREGEAVLSHVSPCLALGQPLSQPQAHAAAPASYTGTEAIDMSVLAGGTGGSEAMQVEGSLGKRWPMEMRRCS